MKQASFSIVTKFFLLIFANLLLFTSLTPSLEFLLIVYLCSFFWLDQMPKKGIFWLLLACLLIGGEWLSGQIPFVGLSHLLLFFTAGLRKLLPVMIAGVFIFSTTRVSEFIYGLRLLHLPKLIIIPLTVLFRFFPTIRQDYRQIRTAMKFRGIAVNRWDLVRHPVQTLEYIYIPLLNNAVNVAGDLTASALTRGITNPAMTTSLTKFYFGKKDLFSILLGCVLLGGVFYDHFF